MSFVASVLFAVSASAQTMGYNRLVNVGTGHVANLSGKSTFAPNVTQQEAMAAPGTIAHMAFEDNKISQLSAQGMDLVNVVIPAAKAMIAMMFPEESYIQLRDTMVVMVRNNMEGAMGTMLAGYMSRFTYEDFLNWIDNIDTNLYYEEAEGGYRIYMNAPQFPLNAGDLNSYFILKVNQYMPLFYGNMQEMAKVALVGRENMLPMIYSFIAHMRFEDRMYLTEQTQKDFELNFGFANSLDLAKVGDAAVWNFEAVDNEEKYFGLQGQVCDDAGNWYASFVAGFPFSLTEGMKAYYVTDAVEADKSRIKRVAVEEDIIPSFTPVIIALNGEAASGNKLNLVEGSYGYVFDDNALSTTADEMGFLLGMTIEEVDPHYYVLGVKDGKVALVSTERTSFKANEAFLYLADEKRTKNTSGYLVLSDEVDGINDIAADASGKDVYYDLMGRVVNQPSKGVYVVKGKKVVFGK